MFSNLLAVFFALASALTVAWGTVIRHRIALEASSSVMRTAMGNPLWWVGTLGAVVAYCLQIIALGFGTLLVVQPILVLSLMFTLPLSAWYSKRALSFHETFWCAALTIAVGVLVVYGRPTAGNPRPSLNEWWPPLVCGAAGLALLGLFAWRYRARRALALGTACGALYGYVALLSKSVVDIFTNDGLWQLAQSWQLYGLVFLAGTGTVLQQYSFHAGPLAQSLPAMTIMEPIIAFSLGYVVLGEEFQVDSITGWSVMAAALAVMILATIVLSRRPVGRAQVQADN
ncbi:DMT family transporter [Corynebacterium striatum]|uniref:DMT family transporter n=1 Tax=Corynebacterium TaxID=1716 RepID=UPI0006669756|nr:MULTISPECIES: DMT family transporter [Corynebacterium]ATZ06432.1 hypothetical protein BBR43_09710 [Corynebacterium striatum]EGT5595183.1 hypothetical protein [Corynebacterium striatum]EGT5786915.1 hypothetical protein [Corynebacterium striatum]MDK8807267.1 DMT family transporter [Corynebacterium striatum]MDK8825272.1 DMT family transporter [Corynebacterium striatum]